MAADRLATRVPRLVLVHWDEDEAAPWTAALEKAGWAVAVETDDPSHAYRRLRHLEPDVVVVSLRRKGDWGFRVAEAVRATRWGREVPFVFVGGTDDDALLSLREDFPEASYVEPAELVPALEAYRA